MIKEQFDEMVGKNLKHYRKRKGLSKYMLEKESRISRATITYIEKGECSAQLYTFYKLANALGIKVTDFLRGI